MNIYTNITQSSQLSFQGAGEYDLAIVGGGLAGLSLAIQSAKAGYKTILFEKEKYPFHKVCGEYISFESWDFLEELGVPLSEMHLPEIKKLIVSSPNGNTIHSNLGLGGFGISRYTLDNCLANIAKQSGVQLMEETKVTDIIYNNSPLTIGHSQLTIDDSPACANLSNEILMQLEASAGRPFTIHHSQGSTAAKVVAGTFGKRSNLDVKWKRSFAEKKPGKLNNYIGVKYHIQTNWPVNTIALHNFKDGYCGISQVDENKFCLCYLTTAANLQSSSNDIAALEKIILSQNTHLKKIISSAKILYQAPLTISQISFDNKTQIENHVLLIGDAAGMITPLCGNGMSMALHGSKIAFECIDSFLKENITREEMEQLYRRQWKKQFSNRLFIGRAIQRFFGKKWVTNLFIFCLKPFPGITRWLIRQTHGQPF